MNNSLCFVGPHRVYNPFSNQFHQLIPGQGHFGSDAIPGVRRAHASVAPAAQRYPFRSLTHTRPPAGRALAPRRGRLAQVRARQHGVARSGGPRANVHAEGALSARSGEARRRADRAGRDSGPTDQTRSGWSIHGEEPVVIVHGVRGHGGHDALAAVDVHDDGARKVEADHG